jgi:hypothetical protein
MSKMSEEEKMLLMNVAQMDKTGDYTVKLQGDDKEYKLQELICGAVQTVHRRTEGKK